MNLQPYLNNDTIELVPLKEEDFDVLYAVASDPLIWEQHPNPDRYKEEVFRNYFKGAMESGGAFLTKDLKTGEVIGCTRFYDHLPEQKEIKIGYTFISRAYWGKKINPQVKKLLLDYAFQYLDRVIFHVGALNIRSQKAMERIGGVKIGEEEVTYYGEKPMVNFVYEIRKE
ncbi:MAG: GNAT family N-acetyltransferase [Chitinophagaceae bacterium]|nr:GNAT family N-acetyltransferase [Chitinophagaceae bacterium]